MKKNKGFTLIELLAVITIVGILSVGAVTAYSRYIKKAHDQQDVENVNTVKSAAKLFLQANKDYMPKTIGETRKIPLSLLRTNNYLKEDVIGSNGESCMEYSYVKVTKKDTRKYTYEPFLHCSSEAPTGTEESTIKPYIAVNFSSLSNVKTASFSLEIYGSSARRSDITIESYSYTIYAKKANDTKYTEYYTSGNISGKKQPSITVNNIKLRNYLDITKSTKVRVKVIARNNLGNTETVTKTTSAEGFKDDVAPSSEECKNIIHGQSTGNSDWVNKADVNAGRKRTIEMDCNDREGSGCVRDKFIKSWPTKNEKSIRTSTIEAEDNSGNKTTCQVLVNVDTIAPTVKVTAKDIKNNKVLFTQRAAVDGANITIDANSYIGVVGGWLNKSVAPEGVKYIFEISDDLELKNYKWQYNNSSLPANSTQASITTIKGESTQNLANKKTHNAELTLTGNGMRYAKLTAVDIAGNTTSVNIYLNLDNQSPICTPQIKDLKGNAYTPGRWLKKGEGVNIYGICSDTGGSLCKGNLTPKTYNTDMEASVGWDATDLVYDNAGNSASCEKKYQVNIDTIPPTLSLVAKPTGKTTQVLSKTAEAGSTTQILANEYSIKATNDNWLNSVSYPSGIKYYLTITDNKYLYKEIWEENKKDLPIGSAPATITSIPSGNSKTTIYSQPSSGHLTSKSVEHELSDDGVRYANFMVYDKAGNSTTFQIYANVDHTPPKLTIHPYIIKTLNGTTYTATNGDAYSDKNNLSKKEVSGTGSVVINANQYANVRDNNNWMNLDYYPKGVAYNIVMEDTLSKLSKYHWLTSSNVTSNNTTEPTTGFNTLSSHPTTYGSSNKGFTLTGNGKRYARITAYDQAGNHSFGHMYANIDNVAPDCSYSEASCSRGSATGWTKGNRTVSLYCSDPTPSSGCETARYYQTFSSSNFIDHLSPGSGTRAIYDNAQNERLCSTAVYTCIDKTKPHTPYVNSSSIVIRSGTGSITSNNCYTSRKTRSYDEEECDVYFNLKRGQTVTWTVHYSGYDEDSGINKYLVSFNCNNGGSPKIFYDSVDASTVDYLDASGYKSCTVVYEAVDYLGNVSEQLFIKEHFTYYD